jgi:hypothetical protein
LTPLFVYTKRTETIENKLKGEKMKMHTIQVDDLIMNFLKKNAEPFSDTPNSVLHKLLFDTREIDAEASIKSSRTDARIPRALSQSLSVIQEVIKNGLTRPEATRVVAERNGTTTQTIIDKYCRQLGKTASEIDHLLQEPGLDGLKTILKMKFSKHEDTIDDFFNNLPQERTDRSFSPHKNLLHSTKIGESDPDTLFEEDKMYGIKELSVIDLGKRTNPKRFRFDGEEFIVNSWADLCVNLVEKLLEKGHLKPSQLPVYSYSSRREKYFISDKPKHRYPEKDAAWKKVGQVYVDIKYNADAHFRNISHLFQHLNLNSLDFGISFK